ncbi:two-component system response regulator [gut metagenome]|uniref:Two-component system response regulator n=1 Tax=gut metagenome TaxID=749906 RepID=J9F4M3_9ZZZZ
MKILLVEDDADLREVTERALLKERYVVETAATYRAARQKALVYEYDCILLDIMLPDGNGLDLLRDLRQSDRPMPNVIILSAKDSIEDKVEGLDLGADDYLPKPYHLAELHARLKSVLRRRQRDGGNVVQVSNVVVHPDSFKVEVNGVSLDLSRKEYDILFYFMNRLNRLVEKQTLAEAVWGDSIDQADNFDFIYAQLKNLRKKLKEAGAQLEIKTVYGFGYKLVEGA